LKESDLRTDKDISLIALAAEQGFQNKDMFNAITELCKAIYH
jgi:hypothetical protein